MRGGKRWSGTLRIALKRCDQRLKSLARFHFQAATVVSLTQPRGSKPSGIWIDFGALLYKHFVKHFAPKDRSNTPIFSPPPCLLRGWFAIRHSRFANSECIEPLHV